MTPLRRLRRWCLEWWVTNLRDSVVNRLAGSAVLPERGRLVVLRAYGLRIGDCTIAPGCWFGGSNINIGERTFINRCCVFDNSAQIDIGDGCSIGMQVTFITSDHEVAGSAGRAGRLRGAPITVGNGAWIGTRATLLPGATVGAGSVVAAGSVVLGDCAPDSLYAGVPARMVRPFDTA